MLATPFFHAIFFGVYNLSKPIITKKLPEKNNFLFTEISCSIVSGIIADFITNPLWVNIKEYFKCKLGNEN